MNYWQEAVECALEDAGVAVTAEQLAQVVESIKTSRECESMCYAPVENPLRHQMEEVERSASARERELEARLDAAERLALRARGFRDEPHERSVTVRHRDGRANFEELR
jgi:hypothetical protein